VTAPKDQILQRLQLRNSLTAEQAQARIDSQLRQEERLPYADVVLENQGLFANLLKQVDLALAQLEVTEN
jgi:dephospho-CoA kinase